MCIEICWDRGSHRQISACFQEHARFEFTIRDTVGIGDLHGHHLGAMQSGGAIDTALDRAGALQLVAELPNRGGHLFERWTRASRHASARGGVTVVVSHRFSTVQTADLILVLDRGRVLEFGTHADLIARGGRYAEMYELQARSYR